MWSLIIVKSDLSSLIVATPIFILLQMPILAVISVPIVVSIRIAIMMIMTKLLWKVVENYFSMSFLVPIIFDLFLY